MSRARVRRGQYAHERKVATSRASVASISRTWRIADSRISSFAEDLSTSLECSFRETLRIYSQGSNGPTTVLPYGDSSRPSRNDCQTET